eukprot:2095364-Amphidinium_carterae.1
MVLVVGIVFSAKCSSLRRRAFLFWASFGLILKMQQKTYKGIGTSYQKEEHRCENPRLGQTPETPNFEKVSKK